MLTECRNEMRIILEGIMKVGSVPKSPVFRRARLSRRAFVENCLSNACIFVILPVYL